MDAKGNPGPQPRAASPSAERPAGLAADLEELFQTLKREAEAAVVRGKLSGARRKKMTSDRAAEAALATAENARFGLATLSLEPEDELDAEFRRTWEEDAARAPAALQRAAAPLRDFAGCLTDQQEARFGALVEQELAAEAVLSEHQRQAELHARLAAEAPALRALVAQPRPRKRRPQQRRAYQEALEKLDQLRILDAGAL